MKWRTVSLLPGLMWMMISVSAVMAQEIHWVDGTSLEIEGKGWAETSHPYDRLPDSAQAKVTPSVWGLSKNSAGVCLRFETNSPTVSVRWSVTSSTLGMPHMPATGVSGIDLYTRTPQGKWKFVGNGRPATQEGNIASFSFEDGARENRECLVYLPLYNGTASVEVGVPAEMKLTPPAPRPASQQKPVVVYGTSIAQGGCASRPGMAWTGILGRLLDRPVINLGFSGSGRMEPPVGEPLAELAPAVYIMDCTWNMGDPQEVYTERIAALVNTIRATHPETPIIFVGQSHILTDSHPRDLTMRQINAVRPLQEAGIPNLILVPGEILMDADGEGTVDGCHPNDLGMDVHARALVPFVQEALQKTAK